MISLQGQSKFSVTLASLNLIRIIGRVKKFVRKHAVWTIEFLGRKFRSPIFIGFGFQDPRDHERWMGDLLLHLRDHVSGTFVDVGANMGQTLMKALSVLGDVPYVGFEPNSACACYLNLFVRENQLKRCIIIPAAVGGKIGVSKLSLFSHRSTDATGSMRPELRGRAPTACIHIVVVDLFATLRKVGLEQVGMLKVDVEGGELEVLQSADAGIREFRPILLIEVLAVRTEERAVRLNAMNDLVCEWNYRCLRIVKDAENALSSVELVDRVDAAYNQEAEDYMLVPSERVTEILGLNWGRKD